MSEQATLYPQAPPQAAFATLAVGELPMYPFHAPGWLVDSIKANGIITPLIVADHGDDGYSVIEGKRRLAAARLLDLDTVPARVFDAADVACNASAWEIALNELRASNHVTNLDAVLRLYTEGRPIEDIGHATGLTVPTIKAYLAGAHVHGTILQAFRQGLLKWSVLRLIAKSPRATQMGLVEKYLEPGKQQAITARMVREANDPNEAECQKALFWLDDARETLRELVDRAPQNDPSIANWLESLDILVRRMSP